MKVIKHSKEWFDNQVKQIMHRDDTPKKREQRLRALVKFAKEKGIKTHAR